MNTALHTASAPRSAQRALAAVTALGLGLVALTGCSSQNEDQASSGAEETSASQSTAAGALKIEDGWAKAAEIIFTGRTLSAADCLAEGLANHVVPAEEVGAKARA